MNRILFIGIAVLDHVFMVDAFPAEPVKHRARAYAAVGGGLAANAGVAAARLGADAALISRLGDDLSASAILDGLEREGVDCAMVRRFPGHSSPVSAVLVDRQGERMVINHADPDLPGGTEWLPRSLPADVRAVMGDQRWEAGTAHLFRLARGAGVPAILDADRRPDDLGLLDLATHVALSAQAVREITGIDDPVSGLAALAAPRSNWFAVTLGAGGVVHGRGGELRRSPAFAVDVVDTLAAGDVWHGAFTTAISEGRGEPEAVRFASAAAAIKCTRFGGREGTPDRRTVDEFLESRGTAT